MKKFLAILILTTAIILLALTAGTAIGEAMATSGTAIPETKGDYKTLCLGDTRDEVLEKIMLLDSADEIIKSKYFTTEFFEVKGVFEDDRLDSVSLKYYQDKLCEIKLWNRHYLAIDVDGAIRSVLLSRIKPMFIELYGAPTREYKYPDHMEVMENNATIAVWDLGEKIISLAVEEYKFEYGPAILIQDKVLLQQKTEEERQSAQKAQEKTKGDF